ncbi:LOW QUALITY PROTEIN: hypothetical protein HID58_014138 [Brassica napus]|uniref:RRM domain-containing protein n=1 Tax=Brassica napus TaxID=3708 RepID=A0ABQ8DG94_BRANA|nr:LOW QUALITY PROTEIN: hypothetical protein HID58_014138 [Brassica napus]
MARNQRGEKRRNQRGKFRNPKISILILVSSIMIYTITKKRELEPSNDEEQIETNDQVNQANGDPGEDEPIQDLLEPFSKEQLLDLLKQAANNHPDVANRIREVADEDPSHRKIFVHGLGWDTTTETLIEAFNQHGEIEVQRLRLYSSRSGARNALKQPQKKIGSRMTSCQFACKGPVVEGLSVEHTQRKIYVSNVGAELDPERLLAFFSRFGEVEEGPLGHDKFTGRHKGFCLFVYKSDGPKQGKQQQFDTPSHNNPRYGAPGGFVAGNQAGMGAPAQGVDPAIGQALTALLVSQGAGLGFNPALGQAWLGSFGTHSMSPGAIPNYQTPPLGQGGITRVCSGGSEPSPSFLSSLEPTAALVLAMPQVVSERSGSE